MRSPESCGEMTNGWRTGCAHLSHRLPVDTRRLKHFVHLVQIIVKYSWASLHRLHSKAEDIKTLHCLPGPLCALYSFSPSLQVLASPPKYSAYLFRSLWMFLWPEIGIVLLSSVVVPTNCWSAFGLTRFFSAVYSGCKISFFYKVFTFQFIIQAHNRHFSYIVHRQRWDGIQRHVRVWKFGH